MNSNDRILVTGADGFVGRNLVEYLRSQGFIHVFAGSSKFDLTTRLDTAEIFAACRPDYVFHLAAKVFGIVGNMQNQAVSYLVNLRINTNVVEACQLANVKKIVAMGTVATYPDIPKNVEIGFVEDDIWNGPPHQAEYGYAHAKRAMLAQLEVSGLPFAYPISTNLYGPEDRFNTDTGHVIPSLIRKFHEQETVPVWGDGMAYRDLMYVGDTVRALRLIMDQIEGPVNLATGDTRSIGEVADILSTLSGKPVVWDKNKPVGQAYRQYDIRKLKAAGFTCADTLKTGLTATWNWYGANEARARKL